MDRHTIVSIVRQSVEAALAVTLLGLAASYITVGLPFYLKRVMIHQLVLSPLLEEVGFRCLLQGQLIKWVVKQFSCLPPYVRVHLTAILFGLCHALKYPLDLPSRLLCGTMAYFGGVIYGYFYEKHSLAAAILSHGTYNILSLSGARLWGYDSLSLLAAQILYFIGCRIILARENPKIAYDKTKILGVL